MKKLLIIFVSLFSGSAGAVAYGDAGCGLGSLVMGSETGVKQILAATTNASGMQTFGITTGTSNCSEGGVFRAMKEVPAYIELNKLALAKDAARGQGETLAGLSQLMGCENRAFGKVIKANYNSIFVESKMDSSQIESRIKSTVGRACGV